MSWLTEFAGKAEDLLNRIDNNAATVLNGKEKKQQHRSIIRDDGDLHSVITSDNSSARQVSSFSSTTTPVNLTPKKIVENIGTSIARQSNDLSRDEKLLKYLNNPSVGIESIEKENVGVSTTLSPSKSNPIIEGVSSGLQTENDMLRNEVRSLNVEISLLLGRVKSAEGDAMSTKALLTKKEVEMNNLRQEILALKQQFKDVLKNNEHGFLENERQKMNYKSRSELNRDMEEKISDLQLEMHKREEQFKADLATMRIRVVEMEESLSAAKADHMKEINAAKIRMEELRNELEDYKTRARKSLMDKEALIQELKSTHQTGPAAEAMEINQLRNELEIVSSELEKCEERIEVERRRTEEAALRLESVREESASEINSVRTLLRQEAERRLAAEENCRLHAEELHKVREDLTKQLALMSERFREKVTEVTALRRQITQRGDAKPSMAEAKVSTLTQALVQKQAALESITNERNQLRLELERCKNTYGQYATHLSTRGNVNDTDDAKAQVPTFMVESPYDTGVARKVKRAYSSLDAVSIRTGMFLRRYPLARTFVLCYGVCLHLWVCLVLFSNTPDTKM